MKAKHVIIIVAAGLLVVVSMIKPAYTGPGVHGYLIRLEVAKSLWLNQHKGGTEWPTKKDLLPYLTGPAPWDHAIHDEIYIINKIGAPVYAYDKWTEMLTSVSSNDLALVKYYLEGAGSEVTNPPIAHGSD